MNGGSRTLHALASGQATNDGRLCELWESTGREPPPTGRISMSRLADRGRIPYLQPSAVPNDTSWLGCRSYAAGKTIPHARCTSATSAYHPCPCRVGPNPIIHWSIGTLSTWALAFAYRQVLVYPPRGFLSVLTFIITLHGSEVPCHFGPADLSLLVSNWHECSASKMCATSRSRALNHD